MRRHPLTDSRSAPSSWRTWQRVLNEQWPPHPDRTVAHEPIAVRVRVVWERDGLTWLDGGAIRWTTREVFVLIRDPRCSILGVWVPSADVVRREADRR